MPVSGVLWDGAPFFYKWERGWGARVWLTSETCCPVCKIVIDAKSKDNLKLHSRNFCNNFSLIHETCRKHPRADMAAIPVDVIFTEDLPSSGKEISKRFNGAFLCFMGVFYGR